MLSRRIIQLDAALVHLEELVIWKLNLPLLLRIHQLNLPKNSINIAVNFVTCSCTIENPRKDCTRLKILYFVYYFLFIRIYYPLHSFSNDELIVILVAENWWIFGVFWGNILLQDVFNCKLSSRLLSLA